MDAGGRAKQEARAEAAGAIPMAAPQKQARNVAQRSNSQRLARRVSAANQADWARTRVYEL
jgi:hypothetical protein